MNTEPEGYRASLRASLVDVLSRVAHPPRGRARGPKRLRLTTVAVFALLACSARPAVAHPGWGIAVDSQGHVYFTDIGNETIWKLFPDGRLVAAVTDVWCHHLYLDDQDNLYFDAENYQATTGNSFWKMSPSGERLVLVPSTSNRDEYSGEYTFADTEGNLYFAGSWGVRKRTPLGRVTFLAGAPSERTQRDGRGEAARFSWITGMTRGPRGAFYVVDAEGDRAALRRVSLDGTVATVASDLLTVPADDPFFPDNSFNVIWDLFVADDGQAYLAYTGNRRLLRISPEAEVEELYHAEAPWAPVGVTAHDGGLYVLETAWEEGVGHTGPRVSRLLSDGTSEVLITIG